jgi:YoeB-like toxin of bacterial type II toxin-antitoxin system
MRCAMRLEFDRLALKGLRFWIDTNRRMALKIITLIEDILKTPVAGLGKVNYCASNSRTADHGGSTRSIGWCTRSKRAWR